MFPAIALDAKKYTDRKTFDREFFARVAEAKPDLLVLAGFMRVIDDAVIAAWHGRAINIHPSLLPKYAGLRTHQRALDARDRTHGASVHFVTAQLDGGPVIAQVELDIRDGDDAESLAARLLPLEHRLLVATLEAFANGRIALGEGACSVRRGAAESPAAARCDGCAPHLNAAFSRRVQGCARSSAWSFP